MRKSKYERAKLHEKILRREARERAARQRNERIRQGKPRLVSVTRPEACVCRTQ